MTVTGQKILSVYDPATGTVVQINHIAEDGEFEKKGAFIKNSQGGRLFSGHDSKAEFLCFDLSGLDQLKTWMKNRTPVRFVTYGLDEHILWYEDTYITVDERVGYQPYKRSGFRLYFEKVGGVHSVHKGANLIYISGGWNDIDGNNKLDGWDFSISSGSLIYSVLLGFKTQVFEADGAATAHAFYNTVYPIANAKLFGYTSSRVDATITSFDHKLNSKDFSNSLLMSKTEIAYSNTEIITPPNTYRIGFVTPSELDLSDGQTVGVRAPYIGSQAIQGEVQY